MTSKFLPELLWPLSYLRKDDNDCRSNTLFRFPETVKREDQFKKIWTDIFNDCLAYPTLSTLNVRSTTYLV